MSGANEIAFPDDFEVIDGKVVGKKSNEYAVHDRYVTCRMCSIRRPADRMAIFSGVPACNDHGNAKVQPVPVVPVEVHLQVRQPDHAYVNSSDAPACSNCGDITVRSGSCYACRNCGSTTGCS